MKWRDLFKRSSASTEQEQDPTDPFSDYKQEEKKRETRVIDVKLPKLKIPKFRFSFLHGAKRGLAAVMLGFDVLTFFFTVANPLSLVFLLQAFLMFDYLWKTRAYRFEA